MRGPEVATWGGGASLELVEVMRLGNVDGNDEQTFGRVWDVEWDRLGRIYVLDQLAKAVQVFDTSFGLVRTLGREGSGPGEFQNPFGLVWDERGRLWVVDVSLARYSIFDTAGVHVGEFPRRVGGYGWPWPGQFTDDGMLLELDLQGDQIDRLIGFRVGETLSPVDTFPDPSTDLAPSEFWDLRDERRLGAIVGIPFGRRGYWSIARDGTVWMGHSSEYRLVRRTLAGDTLLIIERAVAPVPISVDERREAIDNVGDYVRHPKMDLSRIPETKAFFRELISDDRGRLWVLREGEGMEWFFDLFGAHGQFQGSLMIPLVPETLPPPKITGDAMLIVTRDSLDVQYVVRLAIVEREAA